MSNRLLEDGVSRLLIQDGTSIRLLEETPVPVIPPASGNALVRMASRPTHGDTSAAVVLMSHR